MEHGAFEELSLIICIAAGVALLMRLLKQPLIIGYIITGIIVGPTVFDIVTANETFEVFKDLGIAMLLFLVGLGLNPKIIKEVGRVALLTGVGQIMFTVGFSYLILTTLGFDNSSAIYVAIAMAFSSTIIILKLLSDKKEQSRLHGKIAIGFLLVQDVVATMALLFVAANGSGGLSANDITELAVKGAMLVAVLVLMSMFIIPRLQKVIAGSQEFLFLFSIAWGLGVGAIFTATGFSLEIGALAAGVVLAPFAYAQETASRLKPVRDFFLVLFFVVLGSTLDLSNVLSVLPMALLLSTVVLIGNPIIVMTIMGLLGYTKKTSFKTSLAVAQISEFSLVLILLANSLGQVDDKVLSLVTMVGLITIAISTYMIIYDEKLFKHIERYLSMFERRKTRIEMRPKHHYDMVLFGYKKGGQEFIKVFQQMKKRFLVIDYDPEIIDMLESQDNIEFLYGDATDIELLEEAGIDKVKLAVSTMTDHEANIVLLQLLEATNPDAVFICNAENIEKAAELYEMGAGYVMLPHYIGSEKMSAFIKKSGIKKTEFRKFRDKHLAYMQSHYALQDKQASDL